MFTRYQTCIALPMTKLHVMTTVAFTLWKLFTYSAGRENKVLRKYCLKQQPTTC